MLELNVSGSGMIRRERRQHINSLERIRERDDKARLERERDDKARGERDDKSGMIRLALRGSGMIRLALRGSGNGNGNGTGTGGASRTKVVGGGSGCHHLGAGDFELTWWVGAKGAAPAFTVTSRGGGWDRPAWNGQERRAGWNWFTSWSHASRR